MIKKKKIVQKPPRHVRKPAMYLNVNRFCGDCGSNKTSFTAINRVQWHRDVDEQGKWTGKYLCSTCYNRKRHKKHDEEIVLMRQKFVEERNLRLEKLEKLEKDDTRDTEEIR
jgi:hypothetical protein